MSFRKYHHYKSWKKSQKNVPSFWIDSVYSSTVSAFTKVGGLDDTFSEVLKHLEIASSQLHPTR